MDIAGQPVVGAVGAAGAIAGLQTQRLRPGIGSGTSPQSILNVACSDGGCVQLLPPTGSSHWA